MHQSETLDDEIEIEIKSENNYNNNYNNYHLLYEFTSFEGASHRNHKVWRKKELCASSLWGPVKTKKDSLPRHQSTRSLLGPFDFSQSESHVSEVFMQGSSKGHYF